MCILDQDGFLHDLCEIWLGSLLKKEAFCTQLVVSMS